MSRSRIQPRARESAASHSLDLIDEVEVCASIGGTKPISRHTLYRLIANGKMPRGVLIAPNSRRYLRHEIEGALRAMLAARRDPPRNRRTAR